MSVNQLKPLLVDGTFGPNSVTTIVALCDDWFRDEASLVSFVFRSIFHDLIAHDWGDEQGVPTPVFNRFVEDVLPSLNAVLTVLPGDSSASLHDLISAYHTYTFTDLSGLI